MSHDCWHIEVPRQSCLSVLDSPPSEVSVRAVAAGSHIEHNHYDY